MEPVDIAEHRVSHNVLQCCSVCFRHSPHWLPPLFHHFLTTCHHLQVTCRSIGSFHPSASAHVHPPWEVFDASLTAIIGAQPAHWQNYDALTTSLLGACSPKIQSAYLQYRQKHLLPLCQCHLPRRPLLHPACVQYAVSDAGAQAAQCTRA